MGTVLFFDPPPPLAAFATVRSISLLDFEREPDVTGRESGSDEGLEHAGIHRRCSHWPDHMRC